MTLPQLFNQQLQDQSFINEEWLDKTKTQLEKDMEACGLKYAFETSEAEELVVELEQKVKKYSYQELQRLLYRIDLPLNEMSNDYYALSLAIWNRELKKVWIKTQFSENTNR